MTTSLEAVRSFLSERAKLPNVHQDLITGVKAGASGAPTMLTATDLHVICAQAEALINNAPLAAELIETQVKGTITEVMEAGGLDE